MNQYDQPYQDPALLQLNDYTQQHQQYQYPQSAPTMFNEENYDNLIKWQLDIKEELVRIEHLLRKHVPKMDEHGNTYYEDPTPENQILNEVGINEIMNLLAWYLNKNIILSNFSEEDIMLRCEQFHTHLTDFIFNNYQRFGLNDKEKIKHYPIMVMNVTNTIEAAYNRALNGGERDSLRTARQVMQTEPIMNPNNPYPQMYNQKQKKTSIFKPWTWNK